MQTLYPRTIAVHRLKTVAGTNNPPILGLTGYSGAEASTSPSDPAGETVLFTAIPASIQATRQGIKKRSSLPGDAVWSPSWDIYVPMASLAKYSVRDRDIIIDDEGYR